jgi:type I restriction enzyme S subunit
VNPQIPENWIKVKFKQLAKEKSVRVDNPGESGYEKYVGLEHLDSGELVVKKCGSTSDVTSTMKLFKKEDILFARRNTYLRRVSVAPFDGVCSGDIIVLEPILKHIVKGFLPIFMQFEPFENKIIALSAGAFSKRIKWGQLSEEEVVIPSIEEQKKIVEMIWSIQDNIEKVEHIISGYEKLNRGLSNDLLTKGIGHTQFKETEVGIIPDTWEVSTIGESCSIENNLRKPINAETRKQIKGFYPYYGPTGIIDYINEYRLEGRYVLIGEDGDHFFKYKDWSMTQLVVGKFNVNNHAHVIRGINNCLTEWVYHYFRHRDITPHLTRQGAARFKLKKATLIELPLAIPPKKEQETIYNILDNVHAIMEKTSLHVDCLKNLKKYLTDKFLSGEVRV